MSITKDKDKHSPKLRVSNKKKVADDFKHTKLVIDSYIGSLTFNGDTRQAMGRDLSIFYDAYNNRLPEEYFTYVTDPYNAQNKDHTNWPARLRSYSIIRPNVDLLEGEYEKRPFSFTIKVHNADAVNIVQEQTYKAILASLEQQFINAVNQAGVQSGVPSQEVQLPDKIKAAQLSNYRDKRAEMGEAALNIIIDQQQLEEKFKRLFRDWLIAGECYTYKGIQGTKMVYERISPLDIDYDKSPDNEYIEDGQWAVRRMYLTYSEVIDRFHKELDDNEIDILEDEAGTLSFRSTSIGITSSIQNSDDNRSSKIEVYHVVWKYLTKIGILTYVDPTTGNLESMEVPEEFKANEDAGESVEWFWVNEVWEGYRLNNDLYVGIRPVPSQRNTVNNMSECKLPYNGKRFSDTHSQNLSIVEMGLDYEVLHRILHFQMEKTIAKSKGKIVVMDQAAIPRKHGWDEEKFFYWADATGWAIIDRSQPNVDKSFNQYSVLDLGLYQHLNNLIQLMEFVKQEWDEILGITRQRKGQVKASDSSGGTQTAVQQSTVISEKVFSRFEEFVRSELQGLLDVSKLAWTDGFQQVHQGDDMRTTILQIDPAIYTEADMGVYISRSARDLQNLELVRQQVQSFSQNGVSPSSIIDIVQARSLSKLKSIMEEAEVKSMEAQKASVQNEQEHEERLEMIRNSFEELKGFIAERQIHVKYDREEDLEILKQSGMDQNPDAVIDPSGAQKVQNDFVQKQQELGFKTKVETVKAKQKDRELDIKEKELKVRKEIADNANKTALKNRVVGEKKSK